MEKKQLKRLPVGIQTFSNIIEDAMLYIDKTEYIWKMIHLSKYVFLSRPRRFGKSLLTSTLRSYFEGRKDLFEGLYISNVEKEWTEYPVLHFSMASGKHMEKDQLERYLGNMLGREEEKWGIINHKTDANDRLTELIHKAYEQTGRKVVVLIDEYDAPLLDVIHEETELPVLRNVMRNFYSPLKDCDPYLHFVFLTGITKFSQLSIFSELNNIKNISMNPQYAAVCGISKEEMLTQMQDYIEQFAEKKNAPQEDIVNRLERLYDGYHFTWPSPDIFNPFSLLNAMLDMEYNNYWFGSGTPTYLIEMMRKFETLPSDFSHMEAMSAEFDAPTEGMMSIIPLLYQSGYVTIKDYDADAELYTLDIPNREVRIGLMKSLLPEYVSTKTGRGMTLAAKMSLALKDDDIDGALSLMQEYLLTVPYCNNANSEGHYQQMLYVILSLLGQFHTIDVEVQTSLGRVDMVMRTKKALYLFELKVNKNAETAMRQIELKNYAARFSLCNLPTVKVGINFDIDKRTITDWRIEGKP
ncbi:MAG: AAA family ATPase [Prevotella sp.]|nr:AAA family ATPase [Prevotella sp.]